MSDTDDLRLLVVEDEPIAGEAHTAYVNRASRLRAGGDRGTSQAAEGRPTCPRAWARSCGARVSRALREADGGRSASELGEALGVSRVTARRYAEHLCETGVVVHRSRYAGAGRPEVEYLWSR